MKKIVINTDWGGFGLSREAQDHIIAARGIDPGEWDSDYRGYSNFHVYDLARDDPDLVSAVETLGEAANDQFAQLKIVEIPDDVVWYIQDYDGVEWVAESHRTWR